LAEEEEADAELEEENVDFEIAETCDQIEKAENALEKAGYQEKLDDARERREVVIEVRVTC